MLHKLIAALMLSLLLPTVAMAFEPGQEQDEEEEWVLYDGAIEPAESADPVREADGTAGEPKAAANGDHGVNR